MKYKKKKFSKIRHIINWPIITMMIFPVLILDLWGEIYHRLSFPLIGIPLVKRKDYIQIDRQKLKYLLLCHGYQ